MPKESHLELKVGIFVFIGIVCFTYFIFSISDYSSFEKGKKINFTFGFANGLKKSAPVRFAGVDTGIVKDLKVFFDSEAKQTKVVVDVWLKADTKIPLDSTVIINQLGLLGEKYIEIIPGVDQENFFEEERTYVGKDPTPQEKITEKISTIAMKLEQTVDGVNSVILTEHNKQSIETTLAGLSHIVTNVKEGHGTVGRLFYDEGFYDDLHALTSDLKENPWKLLYRPKTRKTP